jgi:hypothetical protein
MTAPASPPPGSPAPSPQPGGRHRSLGPLQRFLARTGTVLMIIAALGAGDFILRMTPDVSDQQRPFLSQGEPGETIDAREFTATLVKVRTAGVVKAGNFIHPTQGLWVILRVRFVALREPVQINYASVVDSQGRSFFASDRLRQPVVDGGRILQPGIAVEGDVAFEVPRDATGLTAQFSNAGLVQAMQAITDITLPLDDTVWLSREPVTLEPMEVNP